MDEKILITGINRIIMVGKDEYQEKNTAFKSEKLEHNELMFHFSGEADVFFNGLNLHTSPGSMRFLPAGNVSNYVVSRKIRGECIDIFFDTNMLISDTAFVMDMSKRGNIASLFKKILCTWIAKDEGYYFESISLLYKILSEMQKTTYIPNEHYQKIKPAVDLIHSEFLSREIAMAELTEITGISESYLKRLFYERFGISPKKYIIQMKLNHAAELLRLDKYKISDVAFMSGYTDAYFFSHQFKKTMGISPTDFTKKYKSTK